VRRKVNNPEISLVNDSIETSPIKPVMMKESSKNVEKKSNNNNKRTVNEVVNPADNTDQPTSKKKTPSKGNTDNDKKKI
jgi:hypothetical protein